MVKKWHTFIIKAFACEKKQQSADQLLCFRYTGSTIPLFKLLGCSSDCIYRFVGPGWKPRFSNAQAQLKISTLLFRISSFFFRRFSCLSLSVPFTDLPLSAILPSLIG